MKKAHNLDKYVIFAGARNDVEKFYSAFDAFVFPSRYEGLGIVGLEAQASGLPCVFSDTVPRALAVNHKECRFLPISSQSVGDWIVALHDIFKDKTRDRFKTSSESYDLIKSAGYDVRVETTRVQKLLESYLK